jgi:uncharacterized protein (DUF608 family)
MKIDRRKFLARTATTAGAAWLTSCSAPNSLQRENGPSTGKRDTKPGFDSFRTPFAVPTSMPMGSGAALGGIGTGFIEIRADGCFYEWQIFNAGPWGQNVRSTTAAPGRGPQYLRFLLRTRKASDQVAQIRRLYLRSDESDLYSLPYVLDVQSIDYLSSFPLTDLHYNDSSIPIRVSSLFFSPFIPGNARESGTPGFHGVFTVENTSAEPVEVSLAGFLNNPLATALDDRALTNQLVQNDKVASILLKTDAKSDFPSGIGSLCFSVTGGENSFITGTFEQYLLPGICTWNNSRVNNMLLDILPDLLAKGRLPNTTAGTDPSLNLPTDNQIDALTDDEVKAKLTEFSTDALLGRVLEDARNADPNGYETMGRQLLREVRRNLAENGNSRQQHLTWGGCALASSLKLAPGEKADIRFTLSWFFPHHLTRRGRELGHMYANWFNHAAEVNRFLGDNYGRHRAATETFARTLADTSLGDAMAFSWSSQLSTAVFNTWWTKDGGYAIWEGLGCCGLSTTDVDYQGSFPIVALFPELKLEQMRRIIAHQNEVGQVPHNYPGDVNQVDNGFARVDMNPQFVMMVCRDYLWTGDKDYLQFMWPHIVKAMAFTESLDTNGDGLPDRDTALQTYDQWRIRGTPSYVSSLWIGGLRAAIRIAIESGKTDEARRWSDLLAKASASFDRLLFNGQYYSLCVDGDTRHDLCMTDQISGEWFTRLIGLPTTLSEGNLKQALDSVFTNNFNPEFGVHNATAPGGGQDALKLTNLQAGGVWSGIEFAFAAMLMDHGRCADAVKVVEAVHRRYLRSGQPWNHVECGGHYSRAMSSWTTLLAATGFKPDVPNRTFAIAPVVPGDFHAPWVTASGHGIIRRTGRALTVSCVCGKIEFQSLKTVGGYSTARINGLDTTARARANDPAILEFPALVSLAAGQTLTLK